MSNLDVALKLFRLLNERPSIDSRIVADDLKVSLRTAQRYLLDLSGQPCVIADEKKHTYSLDPEYPLKNALFSQPVPKPPIRNLQREVDQGASGQTYVFCLMCGQARNCFPELSLLLKSSGMDQGRPPQVQPVGVTDQKKAEGGQVQFPVTICGYVDYSCQFDHGGA